MWKKAAERGAGRDGQACLLAFGQPRRGPLYWPGGPRPPEPPQAVAPVGGSTSALLSRPRRAAHTSRAINAIPFSVVAGVGYDWRMSNGQRQAALELTIGVVGSHDLVERIMLSGAATSGPGAPGAAMSGTVPGAAAPGPASGPAGAAAAPGGNGGYAA